ncbi:MAG: hypothetical protein IKY23_12505 [Lachnospiraceae bacterium]|nr:hypothetical protein [Lachnospiraceae bacterium]
MKKKKMKKLLLRERKKRKELECELNSLYEQHLGMLCFLESRHILKEYMQLFSEDFMEDELPFC